jgi:L-lactate dehydrogenase complex protein LldG
MSSKDNILKAIRNQIVESVPLPNLDQDWIDYEDRVTHFAETLQSVGGDAHVVQSMEQVQEILSQVPQYTDAKKCVSTVSGVKANVDFNAIEDPHELEDIDFAVLQGQFAVAENGAVWITDRNIKHRVIYFIPQYLAFVVHCPADAASAIVSNMYQAYQKIELSGEAEFGAFISGPSKTADIEQSLVIGAHGARSLHVFLVENQTP